MEFTKQDIEAIKKFNELIEHKTQLEIAWDYYSKNQDSFCIPQSKDDIYDFTHPLYAYFCRLVDFIIDNQNKNLTLRKIEGLKQLVSGSCNTLNKQNKELYTETLEKLINDL